MKTKKSEKNSGFFRGPRRLNLSRNSDGTILRKTAKAKKAKKEKQKGLEIKNLFAFEPLVRLAFAVSYLDAAGIGGQPGPAHIKKAGKNLTTTNRRFADTNHTNWYVDSQAGFIPASTLASSFAPGFFIGPTSLNLLYRSCLFVMLPEEPGRIEPGSIFSKATWVLRNL
jgi:hypothetical protein